MRGSGTSKGVGTWRRRGIEGEIGRHCLGGGRELYETCWPESIVSVFIPLIAKHSGGQRGDLARPECCNAGVPPETHSAVGLRHLDRVAWRVWRCAHPRFRAGQCVFRAAPVSGWAETPVLPNASPGRGILGIDYRIGKSLFVANERSVRRTCAINARFPAGLEEDFVAAKECQIHTSCPGGFNVGALPARPVFVMGDRHEDLVLSDQRAVAVRIYATEITEVEAVRLEPANHGSFRGEKPRVPIGYGERPVVTDFVMHISRI